jgi:hypothetical protein
VVPLLQQFYVPRDECFNHVKKADFTAYAIKAVKGGILSLAREQFDRITPHEFDDFDDIYKLYDGGLRIPDIPALDALFKAFPPLRSISPAPGDFLFKMPMPDVIKEDKLAGGRTTSSPARCSPASTHTSSCACRSFLPGAALTATATKTARSLRTTSSAASAGSPSTRPSPTIGSSSSTTTTTSCLSS